MEGLSAPFFRGNLFCMPSWSVMPHCRFMQVKCLLVFEIISSYDWLSGDVSTIFTEELSHSSVKGETSVGTLASEESFVSSWEKGENC